MAEEATSSSDRPLAGAVWVDGVPSTMSMVPEDGTIRWMALDCRKERRLAVEKEVLGFEMEGERRIRLKAVVEEEGGFRCVRIGERKARRDYLIEAETEELASELSRRIGACIESLGRPKSLFILLNPFGGKRTARKIFEKEVKPLLKAAGIFYILQETKYQLHAQEIAYGLDLEKYDGIVCVSGDGLLVEVLNGLLRRKDWQSAIKMPLGIIPAGTGNGMIKSLLDSVGETCSVVNAVLTVIQGHKSALDVATITQGETLFFSLLMFCWEKYRWLGSARIEAYSPYNEMNIISGQTVVRLMKLRKYNGRVSFVPASGYEHYGKPTIANVDNKVGSQANQGVMGLREGYHGPVTCFKSSEWRSLDGPFIVVWLHNVPWGSCDAKPAPEAKFSDGCYDLVIVQDCPKPALLSLLLKLGDGTHVKSPYVLYIKVKAFRLEPGHRVGNPDKGGIIDADGEVIARGRGAYLSGIRDDPMAYGPPIELQVEQALATIFAPQHSLN